MKILATEHTEITGKGSKPLIITFEPTTLKCVSGTYSQGTTLCFLCALCGKHAFRGWKSHL